MTAAATKCAHDALAPKTTLVVESHFFAGVRIRCTHCGATADVSKKGRVYQRVPVMPL